VKESQAEGLNLIQEMAQSQGAFPFKPDNYKLHNIKHRQTVTNLLPVFELKKEELIILLRKCYTGKFIFRSDSNREVTFSAKEHVTLSMCITW
jgi:hypothetical protein